MKRQLHKNDIAELIRQGTLKPGCYEEYLRSLPSPGPGAAVFGNEELSRAYDAIVSRETRGPEGRQGSPPATVTRVRRRPARARAAQALEAIYKKDLPTPECVPDWMLCKNVADWLASQKPPWQPVSDDSVLREAGRRLD